jgi:hypothetical protein
MKLTKIALVSALLALAGNAAMAQSTDEKFPDNQLTLDVFGTYHQAFENFGSQFNGSWKHGVWGGGAGVNFFFNKYIGVGVDSYGEAAGFLLNNVSANLYLRIPVGDTGLAPYIFGGAGGDFGDVGSKFNNGYTSVTEVTEDCGIGLAYRFNRHWGIFADTRYTYADKTANTTLTRAGLTFGF